MQKIVLLVLVGLLGTAWAAAEATAVTPQSSAVETAVVAAGDVCPGNNLLSNPSFEGDYVPYVMPPPGHPDCQTWDASQPNQYCERVKTAPDWHPWWRSAPRPEVWSNIQPEYVPALPHEQPPRVRSGEKSQHYFSFWTTHEAGMYQQMSAVPNGRYCFSAWGHAWSARKTLPGYLSDPNDHGQLHQRVGIDPTGGTDWQSPNIIWSDERMQYDTFGQFVVETTAQASTVTVFLYSRANIPVKHNDVYWDDAHLSLTQSMVVDVDQVAMMSDVAVAQTAVFPINITVSPNLAWTAELDSGSTLTPNLSHTSGSSSQQIRVTIDSSGLAIGSYATTLTISSAAGTAEIPIKLFVVEQIYPLYLPLVQRP